MEHLVTCSYDGSVAVWEVRSGQGLQPTQLSRWTAHGPALVGLLPASLSNTSHSEPAHTQALRPPDAAAQECVRNSHLQTRDGSASAPAADGSARGCEDKQQASVPQSSSMQCHQHQTGTSGMFRSTHACSSTQSRGESSVIHTANHEGENKA